MRTRALIFGVAGLLVSVAAGADSTPSSITVIRYRDGGVAARVTLMSDGGAVALLNDGGSLSFRKDSHHCEPDAGVLLALLGQNACDEDRDCVIVQPDVDAANVGCCYAVDAKVARSRSLKDEFQAVADQCGWATRSCVRACERAECHKGFCRVGEASPRR